VHVASLALELINVRPQIRNLALQILDFVGVGPQRLVESQQQEIGSGFARVAPRRRRTAVVAAISVRCAAVTSCPTRAHWRTRVLSAADLGRLVLSGVHARLFILRCVELLTLLIALPRRAGTLVLGLTRNGVLVAGVLFVVVAGGVGFGVARAGLGVLVVDV